MGAPLPTDRRIDRRGFLERMTAITAAATTGAVFVPRGASAAAPPTLRHVPLPDPRTIQGTEPWELTVAELAALIRDGQLSPVDLVEGYLARIERFNDVLQVFNTVTAESALAEARRLEGAAWSGPLHGIPLAIKDNYYTAGVLTTANSHIFSDFVPDFDATTWARLKAGGAILLGKTQMGPLATSRATTPDGEATTLNAWAPQDSSVSPGGSSSGSATAVAARLAASSTGTQTGGSITGPSSAQGLTGLKPTMGRSSLYGIIPLTYTRDHPGPLARDARDAAIMVQTMAGPDPADGRTLGLPPLPDLVAAAQPVSRGSGVGLRWPTTIGVIPGYLDEPRDPPAPRGGERREVTDEERDERRRVFQVQGRATAAARRHMLADFESMGANVVEIEFPQEWETLTSFNFNNVRLPERAEPFLEHLQRDVRLFGVSLSPWINGLLLSGPEYLRGQRAKLFLLQRVLDGVFDQCDVVVQTAPFPFDMIGLPLIAFPIGMHDARGFDLPVAAMLGGQPYAEDRLVSLVGGFQAVTDWHQRRAEDPDLNSGGPSGPGRAPPRLDIQDIDEDGE